MYSARFFVIWPFVPCSFCVTLGFIFWVSSTLVFFQFFESAHLPHGKSFYMLFPMSLGLKCQISGFGFVLLGVGLGEAGCAKLSEFVVKHSLVGLMMFLSLNQMLHKSCLFCSLISLLPNSVPVSAVETQKYLNNECSFLTLLTKTL